MNEIAEWWNTKPCEAWHNDPTWHRYFVQPHIRKFAQFDYSTAYGPPWWYGKRVLEIGCGIGIDTMEFVKVGAIVDAMDFSDNSLYLAKQRYRESGIYYRASFWWGDAEKWLPDGRYDLIYSFGVLHHTPHPEKVLAIASTRLRSDGELRIMLYAKWSIKHLFGIQPEAQAGCPLVRWYSKREARKLLESCGFEVVSIEKTHIFPWRISDYREHRFVKAFPWNITPKWLFRWLESKLGHHLLLVARRSPKTANDPASV